LRVPYPEGCDQTENRKPRKQQSIGEAAQAHR
jgi:hypothetical protein